MSEEQELTFEVSLKSDTRRLIMVQVGKEGDQFKINDETILEPSAEPENFFVLAPREVRDQSPDDPQPA